LTWAVVGGSGALPMAAAFAPAALPPNRFGEPAAGACRGRIAGHDVLYLPRHGRPGHLAPHLVNYRANVEALRAAGVQSVLALNTVGGISAGAVTGAIVVPDQIIDYTWGREHTFAGPERLLHADFAEPFDAGLRRRLLRAARAASLEAVDGGVYGATQGPRFETVAEIERMARDGCDLVGMTGMPEAALAREAGLVYAMVSLVVNPAAGRVEDPFDLAEIEAVAARGMARIETLLLAFFEGLDGS
jgi:purine nucleoside phosphorylase